MQRRGGGVFVHQNTAYGAENRKVPPPDQPDETAMHIKTGHHTDR
ncbi:hypothetical protein RBSWK_04708 [Rhodopirellula baltica SWK14]|uniref:Uncharacterized protein n=1 Tax=Rhodopirellula baltica SWK14 TaxID=993516 RepID=L7CC23_RHOBT|nr:hypothetical protein RBSWK_04708 [Rhodopirellula baltica SWK14]